MAVPAELYEKRIRGRTAALACRGCGEKIRLDGTGGDPPPRVTGGRWLEILPEPEPPPAAPPPVQREPLARIGRYALFEQFASGGMATVHLGRLDGAGGFTRVVAIKRLLPHLVMNEDFTQMLLKEARLAARVRNPNVVPTVDVVASKGDVLLVLEYVHGEALSTLCRIQARERREHVPLDIAVGVMQGVLAGLGAVHEATDEQGRTLGLVHRDISPPNVIVGSDGMTRVLDFGIAKALEHIEDSNPNRTKGKAGYMSPEQVRGERVTQRSDVFSAGIILWELLATRRLFTAEADTERMQKILAGGYPSPGEHRPNLPAEFDNVTMRALALDPDQRYASPREFAVALEHVAVGASPRKIADWVNDLAAEALAVRARMVAQVETWETGAPDLPLNSTPFAAEVAILMTAPPPGATVPPPPVAIPAPPQLPSVPPPPLPPALSMSVAPPDFKPRAAARWVSILVGVALVTGLALAYLMHR
ncbi:MAG TPA: serine/threonine-protein kinase [Polyangiaceae bacterium]|nr:serine/threonine-protein kinase [Polyangiaceae bacterium]